MSYRTLKEGPRLGTVIVMDLDACLAKVGGYRRYSLAAFFIMGGTLCSVYASQNFLFVFIGRTPAHHCTIGDGGLVNESIPVDEVTGALYKCIMYAESSTNVTTSCDYGWTYNNVDGDYTIVNEWDLVCDRSFLPDMTMMVFGIGAMVGDFFGNIIADKFGRKGVHITGYIIITICGSANAFSQNFNTYIALVFLTSICNAACLSSAFTHLCELFDSKRRAFVGMGIEYIWVCSILYVGVMGYFVRYWRHLQLVLSLTSLLGLLHFLFPESPQWLLANHKYKRAEAALRQMARWNGVHVDAGQLLALGQDMNSVKEKEVKKRTKAENYATVAKKRHSPSRRPPDETGHETLLDLFRWPLMLKYIIISSVLWFANLNVYYFMILNTPSLAGDLYLNFFMGCVVEIPAYTVSIIVIKYSRRIPTVVFLLSASVSLVALASIQHWGQVTSAVIFFALFGKFCITVSFAVMVLYTREIFPTNLRGTSFGIAILIGRLGMILAPVAVYKAKSVPWLPNLVLGVIAFVVGLLCLLLPETKNWPSLPMSIADVYRYSRGEFEPYNPDSQDEGQEEERFMDPDI